MSGFPGGKRTLHRCRRVLMRTLLPAMLVLFLFAGGLLAGQAPVWAQIGGLAPTTNVFLTSVSSERFPLVEARIYATDSTGLPVANLQKGELTVAVEGIEVQPTEFDLLPVNDGGQSVVIVLDTTTNEAAWASALTSAQNLLSQLAPGDAAAIVTIGDVTQVHSTLSASIQEARNALAAIAELAPQGTQSLANQAIMDGLSLFAAGEAQDPEIVGNRRSLVLLTERAGAGDNPTEGQPDTAAVTQFAQQEGVSLQLFAWGAAASAAQDLLDLAVNTGGRFTPLATAGDANGHFQTLPSLLRPGYMIALTSDLPANNAEHTLLVAGASARPMQRTFLALPRPVEVEITQPEEGATVSGNVVVAVSVSSPATIQSLTFALASGEIITTTNGPVGGILWDTAELSAGAQSIVVQAVDAVGNSGTTERNVLVRAPVVLGVQTSGDSAQVGSPMVITATVDSVLDGVIVEAFLGRTQVGVAANPTGPVSFQVDTTPFVPGRYALVVRATNSGGYSVTNNSNVLTLTPAPVRPTPAQDVASGMWTWINRWWLPVLLGLVGLLLLWWIVSAIVRWLRRREAIAAQRALQVHPQMRILLTNSGNVRTRYRLRAVAKEGEYKFTFIHNGAMLVAPAIEHVAQTNGAAATNGNAMTNGRASTPLAPAAAYAPAGASGGGATPVKPANVAATAQEAAKKASAVGSQASQVGNFAFRFLDTLSDVIPGSVGASIKRASLSVRGAQTAAQRSNIAVRTVTNDVQDVGAMSKYMATSAAGAAGATGKAGGGQAAPAQVVTAQATPSRYAAQPATSSNTAFALQPSKSTANGTSAGSMASAATRWVETPPVAPGDTIGVDLFVQPARGRAKNKRVDLRLYTAPAEAEGAPPSVDEVSVLLT